MTLQSGALLALLKIDFIQKFLMIVWLSISYFLLDKGWFAHHGFKFMVLNGELLDLLANKTLRHLFRCLSTTYPPLLNISLPKVPCLLGVCDIFYFKDM